MDILPAAQDLDFVSSCQSVCDLYLQGSIRILGSALLLSVQPFFFIGHQIYLVAGRL